MSVHINIVVDQGSKFTSIIVLQNDDGTIFDLTGYTAHSQMRKSYYTKTFHEITAEVLGDPANGEIQLTIPPSVSDGIRAGRYVYDVEIHDATGEESQRVVQGIVTVTAQVTKIQPQGT